MKVSRVDNIVTRIKNNPILALLITAGIIVIALAKFTGALKNLLTTIDEIVGHPAPVDISGKWKAEKTEKTSLTYFDFKVVDDKLYGTVWLTPTFDMQHSESGIIDGQIIGNRVSFTTKHEYIRKYGHYNSETRQWTPDVRAELIVHYDGEIRGDEIHFRKQTGGGYYAEIIAKKIVDLTEITTARASPEKKNVYALVYVLPGHEGGVQSLSFGPDQGRLRSGGLRLTSGGAKDGKIKYWDVATAEHRSTYDFISDLHIGTSSSQIMSDEPSSTDDFTSNRNSGPVYLAYSPKMRERGVDFTVVGVSKDGHIVKFYTWYFYHSGGAGGGGRTEKFSEVVGPVVISGDSHVIATVETEITSKFTITVRNTNGNVKIALNCEGIVRAIALSFDGNLLASAEAMKSNETILKLWDVATGIIKWRAVSQPLVSHLAISPDAKLLASGCVEDGQIGIWDASTGSLKFTLSDEQDNGISSLKFSNNGKLLASAGFPSGVIKLWNASTGTLDHAINNEGPVGALSFSYDDRLLATVSSDKGIIKVWAKPKNEKITQ